MSLWVAFGAAVCLTSLSGIMSSILIVFWYGLPSPTMQEFIKYKIDWVAIALFTGILMLMVVIQHDRWEGLFKGSQKQQRRRVPRPLVPRNMGEARQMSSQMAVGKRGLFPLFTHHYAALYLRLERNKWKITKRMLNFEVDTIKVFPNISEKYMPIVNEWNRCGFVDGYITGEAREKWFLNEAGQVNFAAAGKIPSPTETD